MLSSVRAVPHRRGASCKYGEKSHSDYSSDYKSQKAEIQFFIATNVATKKENQNANQNANQGTVCILERRSDEADER